MRWPGIPQIPNPRTPNGRPRPALMAWCGWLCWAGLGALISKGVGPWGPLWLRAIMAMMRHNGDHISYVLMGDDPLITLTINPKARLEHRAPPSYSRLSHLRRHA